MQPGGLNAVGQDHWFAMSLKKCKWFCTGIVNTFLGAEQLKLLKIQLHSSLGTSTGSTKRSPGMAAGFVPLQQKAKPSVTSGSDGNQGKL